ncbi:MAG: isochorismatase family protein [Phycisphaerae bacterium]|nr:isochorismatase family protein [Phycisphaerae bacterium]
MAKFFRRKYRRVLIDVDTQYDLIYKDRRDKADLLKNIRRLFAWSRVHKIPVVSTALTRRKDTPANEIPNHKAACIEDTPGHKKIRYTMLTSNIRFGPENRFDLPRNLLSDYRQVIFEKRSIDPFEQPRADRMFSEIKADEFIVMGIGLDNSLKTTVLGLLKRGKKVSIVRDAIDDNGTKENKMNFRKMEAKGAKLVTTESVAGSRTHLKGKASNKRPWLTSVLLRTRIA